MRIIERLRESAGQPVSTRELHEATGSLAVSRDVSNARAMLVGTDEEISPAQVLKTLINGTKIYVYTLLKREVANAKPL
jgi:hypothetical protein